MECASQPAHAPRSCCPLDAAPQTSEQPCTPPAPACGRRTWRRRRGRRCPGPGPARRPGHRSGCRGQTSRCPGLPAAQTRLPWAPPGRGAPAAAGAAPPPTGGRRAAAACWRTAAAAPPRCRPPWRPLVAALWASAGWGLGAGLGLLLAGLLGGWQGLWRCPIDNAPARSTAASSTTREMAVVAHGR